MGERHRGNFEITDMLTGLGRTVAGRAIDPARAEVALAALEGLTGMVAAPAEAVGTAAPEAAWTATDAEGRQVTVRLWREPPIDETAIGRALAAAMREERRERG